MSAILGDAAATPTLCSACAAHVLEATHHWTPLLLSEAGARGEATLFVTSAVRTLRAAAPGLLQDEALLNRALEYCQGDPLLNPLFSTPT